MHRKIFVYALLSLSAVGIAYSVKQLADPVPVKGNEPVCCLNNQGCKNVQTCGLANCDGLKGGACG